MSDTETEYSSSWKSIQFYLPMKRLGGIPAATAPPIMRGYGAGLWPPVRYTPRSIFHRAGDRRALAADDHHRRGVGASREDYPHVGGRRLPIGGGAGCWRAPARGPGPITVFPGSMQRSMANACSFFGAIAGCKLKADAAAGGAAVGAGVVPARGRPERGLAARRGPAVRTDEDPSLGLIVEAPAGIAKAGIKRLHMAAQDGRQALGGGARPDQSPRVPTPMTRPERGTPWPQFTCPRAPGAVSTRPGSFPRCRGSCLRGRRTSRRIAQRPGDPWTGSSGSSHTGVRAGPSRRCRSISALYASHCVRCGQGPTAGHEPAATRLVAGAV
jgi:hypothetical protein